MKKNYRILLLSTRGDSSNSYLFNSVVNAFKEVVPEDSLFVAVGANEKIIDIAKNNKINLLVAFGGEQIDFVLYKKLALICGRSALWVTEDPYEININKKNAEIFDYVFTNDAACIRFYGEKAAYLPLAADEKLNFHEIAPTGKDMPIDIFFQGTAWPNRVKLINEIINYNWSVPVSVKIGLPTNRHIPEFSLRMPKEKYNYTISARQFSFFANHSLVTLCIPRDYSLNGFSFTDSPPPRLYEAGLAGSVQLVDARILINTAFEESVDFLYYRNVDDISQMVYELKSNLNWRNKIASNMQEKIRKFHLYKNRIEEIFCKIERSSDKFQYCAN
jgi:spore maturation protein CgeB